MAAPKKYNLVILRKKICDNCNNQFTVTKYRTCPLCGSHKIHYMIGTGAKYIKKRGN